MPHFSCVGCLFGLVDTDLCLRRFLHHSVKVLVLPASGWAFFWVWLGLLMVGCFFCFFFTCHIPPLLILTSGLQHFYLLKNFLPWFYISPKVLHTKLNIEFQMRLLEVDNME